MSITFSAHSEIDAERGALIVPEDVELNVSNVNGRFLLDALGIVPEDPDDHDLWWGEIAPADFLGRVLLAAGLAPADAGVPAHEVPTTGARWIECGRRAGYLQERLAVLATLAQWALAHDAESIVWG